MHFNRPFCNHIGMERSYISLGEYHWRVYITDLELKRNHEQTYHDQHTKILYAHFCFGIVKCSYPYIDNNIILYSRFIDKFHALHHPFRLGVYMPIRLLEPTTNKIGQKQFFFSCCVKNWSFVITVLIYSYNSYKRIILYSYKLIRTNL